MKVVSLGYQTDLALLQLGGTQIEDSGDHLVVRSPHNPTHWWGNFLLLDHVPDKESSESCVARFLATFPDAAHLALGFDGTGGRAADLGWFQEQGFLVEAATVMTATEVHEPERANTEATYRQLCSDEDWAQSIELRVRCNERKLEPVGYRRYATATTRTNRQVIEGAHGSWFGAFLGYRLVSQMGLFKAGPALGRFQHVETDPDYRRLGLAGSLLHHASRYGFDEIGARTLVMVADPSYYAIDLYRAVGFAATEAQLQVERQPADAHAEEYGRLPG